MTLKEDVDAAVVDMAKEWSVVTQQSGSTSVPDTDTLVGTSAKKILATYLYTDIKNSSGLMKVSPAETVASVMAAFLKISVRIIRHYDGHIRSFDGDRVMGVFTGPDRQSRAATAALKINYAVRTILEANIQSQFGSIHRSNWNLQQMTGIASGDALLVKVGIRNNADILSAGIAPNLAAKLSDLRLSNSAIATAIGKGTYNSLNDSAKLSKGVNMWTGPYSIGICQGG
ncbi:adenylate/guanylate cyclase domain-containing protein [Cryobacterium frigoriphilum]|uniref:Adenylate/guanylate cyclase domain-containing protein n=1 Tax=Cryobacterium frigoriphilum TaxID=1259150 RepID=A0A4R8ZWT6_9MICO|nr:adenylate/guanylate cyclase domain-containing protein [Cryobacterium frigoriphilum]TFD48155.1 adenylate/guanylate cyclase domain-containing protein [Cryobacterium frigoriphilum]